MCDVYLNNESAVADSIEARQILLVSTSTMTQDLNSITIENDEERRSFSFFRCQFAPELTRALDTFWYSTALSFSQSDSVIRHTLIALGALAETLMMNTTLISDDVQADSRYEFACHHYYKAIRQLRERIGNGRGQSTEFTLMSCFLFICFEFLRSNDVGTAVHLRSGLHILRRSCSGDSELVDDILSTSSASFDKASHHIRRIFAISNLIARRWLGLPSIQSEGIPPIQGPRSISPIPTSFSSLEEAEDFLKEVNRLYHFGCSIGAYGSSRSAEQVRLTALSITQELTLQIDKWPVSMDNFLQQISPELTSADLHRITFLNIRHKVITAVLMESLQPSPEAAYEHYNPVFEEIVSLAASLIRQMKFLVDRHVRKSYFVLNLFDFNEGVIHALYFTAIKCRDRNICQKAISLLSSHSWREGAWGSVGMAQIAERNIRQLEEKGYYYQ